MTTLGEVRLDHAGLSLDLRQAVLGSPTVELSTGQVNQLVLSLSDPGYRLLASEALATKTPLGALELDYEIAAVEVVEGQTERLALTARPSGVQLMRRDWGELVDRDVSPTGWLALRAAAFNLGFVGEETAKRQHVTRAGPRAGEPRGESSWDVGVRLAEEEGFWFFESSDTLFFGRPTWLVGLPTNAPAPLVQAVVDETGTGSSGGTLAALACKYWSGEDRVIAFAVALAESAGVATARHVNTNGTVDYGYWQVNSVHATSGFDVTRAFEPDYNAEWAHWVWADREGWGPPGWKAWATYNNGAYLAHMTVARQVIATAETVLGTVATAAAALPVVRTAARGELRIWVVRWPVAHFANELRPNLTPGCRRSEDSSTGDTLTLTIAHDQAWLMRPGDTIDLYGVPTFEQRYVVTSVALTADGASAGTVTAEAPRDPQARGQAPERTTDDAEEADAEPAPGEVGTGDWGGAQTVVEWLTSAYAELGLTITSAKRPRRNTASGSISDHWTGNLIAYARDISNGSSPTPQMDALARAIMTKLGAPHNGEVELHHRGNHTYNGKTFRVEVIYRSHDGGNHFNHIHCGAELRT